ncbi:hypothetical protein ALO95_03903 [Pseudomonas syringae pv. antirrhini]|uniref:Uncharacterized protein n=1 Tax=Pseudomonas syringae pv. antirrhini TaxID=251702 RepID=A0A0P9P0E2_9PSED|nr:MULTISPECIES: hypothetical protein [Pseudomonas]KPW50057.1 Uncharacterized protein ALO88_03445 [Pseudomonas syringae pv. antirrhini]RMP42806.1 hypothetical protein ALQ23_03427 [Pseudomonas syringae pv. antirrhini]RMW30730.1 hypothetical protein ALO95_03903 [Pseudomonas syringae pv. antirrhini]WIN06006.1 hypothetical protein QQF68_20760 [Pseudomonas syringae pv. antirrhini str. 126]
MHISTITSDFILSPSRPSKPLHREPLTLSPEAKPKLSEKEEFANAFYTRVEEPWLQFTSNHTDDKDPTKKVIRPMTKERYLENLNADAILMSRIQSSCYQKLRAELVDLRPDLAGKNFSYTVGDDAELKIIDLDDKLGTNEIKYLSDAINQKTQLKDAALTHAKILMTLADHDTDTFKGTYKLDLLNFKNIIDLGKIALSKKDDPSEIWINQIKEKAEKNSTHLIDTRA